MPNIISTLFAIDTDDGVRGLDQLKAKLAETDGLLNKTKVGASGLFDMVKTNASAMALGAGAAITAFATKAAADFSSAGVAADRFANSTGMSVENASRWLGVMSKWGVEIGDLQDVFNNVASLISEKDPVFDKLGITIRKTAAGSVDMDATMKELVRTVGAMTDPAERAAAAAKFFGEEGARQFSELLAAGRDLDEIFASLSEGQVIDEDEARKAKEFAETMREAEIVLRNVAMLTGEIVVGVANWVSSAREFGRDIRRALDPVADANWEQIDAWEASKRAAADFDRQLIANATSAKQVHDIVLQATGDLTAANIVSVEWAEAAEAAEKKRAEAVAALTDKQANQMRVGDMANAMTEARADAQKRAAEVESDAARTAEHHTEVIEEQRRALLDAIAAQRSYQDSQRGTASAADELQDALADQERLLREGTVSSDEKARALDDVADAEAEVADKARELEQAYADQEALLRDSIATDQDKADALRAIADAQRDVQSTQLGQREAELGIQEAQASLEDAKRRLADLQAQGPRRVEIDPNAGSAERARQAQESTRAVEDHSRAIEEAHRNIARAEINLERATMRVTDANEDAEDATNALADAQAAQTRLLEQGKATDDEKAAAQRRIEDAEKNLQTATWDANAAQAAYEQLLRDSIPTDDEKAAAQGRVETAIRNLGGAALEQAEALAAHKGAIEGTTGSFYLQRVELEALIGLYPQLRGELQPTIDMYNQLIGITPGSPPVGVAAPSGGGLPVFRFDSGGVVPGPRGKPQLVVAEGGETIWPTHREPMPMGGNLIVQIQAGAIVTEHQLGSLINRALTKFQSNGGRATFTARAS